VYCIFLKVFLKGGRSYDITKGYCNINIILSIKYRFSQQIFVKIHRIDYKKYSIQKLMCVCVCVCVCESERKRVC